MPQVLSKPRLAVVSPFLDKSHGTERCVSEWISRLTEEYEVHIYSQDVQDLNLQKIVWHKIPKLPGPHLFNYLWWFTANQFRRAWDSRVGGLAYDLVFSPGINCLDADAMSVHIVFAQYVSNLHGQLDLKNNPLAQWPVVMHRRLYYKLIEALERHLYTRTDIPLVFIARRTVTEITKFYGPRDQVRITYPGRDRKVFNSLRRRESRQQARMEIGLSENQFAILLVGNDWRNKGVPVLLEAMSRLEDLPIKLLLVSREDSAPVRTLSNEKGLGDRVHFLPPRADVDFYYSAADVYAGPSLEDTFAFPPAEAMAMGLPVIVSSENGVSEIITHGVDGLILEDSQDSTGLAQMLRQLYEDHSFAVQLGENAEKTAAQFTWERNARELSSVFHEILRRKGRVAAQTLPQEL
jgi:glycosyltransferase involved in cell wall biosynthesis